MADVSCHQFRAQGNAILTILRHFPEGLAWYAWHTVGKTANKLLSAIAEMYEDASEALCRLIVELDPRATTEFITEWERAVGLPDACLPDAVTIEERRAQVMFRLDKRRWSTAADWIELAQLFGLTITVTPGWRVQKPALYPFCYPRSYILLERLGRFHVYVDIVGGCGEGGYIYTYPLSYGFTDRCADFKCMINRIKPANVIVIFNDTPPIPC